MSASCNDYGGGEDTYGNAIVIEGLPNIEITVRIDFDTDEPYLTAKELLPFEPNDLRVHLKREATCENDKNAEFDFEIEYKKDPLKYQNSEYDDEYPDEPLEEQGEAE